MRRLRTFDRIFFITINLRRALPPLTEDELTLVANSLTESRRRLGFSLFGYVLMPDHWHALIWPAYPLTISRAVQDIKWNTATALNRSRQTSGTIWQRQFWDRFVRHGSEFRQQVARTTASVVRVFSPAILVTLTRPATMYKLRRDFISARHHAAWTTKSAAGSADLRF